MDASSEQIHTLMADLGARARAASRDMARASAAAKDRALIALAAAIRAHRPALQDANLRDLHAAREAGLEAAFVDRLTLSDKVVEQMAQSCEQVAALADPIGGIDGVRRRPSGISVGQMRVPLGVFGMIYESRPNVTIEAASLAIKSGNAVILRGGSEAIHSNRALAEWAPLFKDELLASAALDRLLHHAHVVEITGSSHRNPPRGRDPKSRAA